MKTIVRTIGTPPAVRNAASLNAPQGAIALADLLSVETFADVCTIDIDWAGDGLTPAMTIYTVKFFPQYAPENLQHFWPVDIEEAFGQDHMTNSILRDIVKQLKDHFNDMVTLRERKETDGTWKKPGEAKIYAD